jgi:hypothetical protein
MNELNYKQTAFLLNISDDAAINIFIRYLRQDKITEMGQADIVYQNNKRKELLKDLRQSLKGEKISIDKLTEHFNLDVSLLINSINDRFFKSKECLDYLESYFKKKWKPDKFGFYPLSMTAPQEVTSFMNESSIGKLIEWFEGRYMSGPDEHKIECILKIK